MPIGWTVTEDYYRGRPCGCYRWIIADEIGRVWCARHRDEDEPEVDDEKTEVKDGTGQ